MRRLALWTLLVSSAACAHRTVVAADLDRVHRPAFVSRIEEGAGPRARVFREDASWSSRLQHLETKEADRRLSVKLAKALTRFQVSEGLRAAVLALLPKDAPWTRVVPPASVASVLESFLVEEVPANAPDYNLLRSLGADSVVELVVEDYGMRSEHGHAQAYVAGYGRLFFLDGGTAWFRPFERDGVTLKLPDLDPFEVGKQPEVFRDALAGLLESVAEQLALDLRPPERRAVRVPVVVPEAAAAPAMEEGAPPKKEEPRPHLPEDDL